MLRFKIGKGKARESRARCMLKVGEEVYEADKQTVYDYKRRYYFLSILIIVLLPIIVS